MSTSSSRKIKSTKSEQIITFRKKLSEHKKFGLIWEQKKEQVIEDCKKKLPVLKETESKAIIKDKNQPTNLIIEGDNYHALSTLNYTHKGKIDVIYIDPPYNTGARDWRYNNNYVDINDQWRHSKWISMIKPRITLAKKLLTPGGFLICSIDENEIHNIRHILDETFGESNKVGMVTILHNPKGRNQATFFSENSEFMLVYAKNKSIANFNKVALLESVKNTFNLSDNIGSYRLEPFMRARTSNSRENKPDNFYPIYVSPDKKHLTLKKITGYKKVLPIASNGKEYSWKRKKESFIRDNKDNYFSVKETSRGLEIFHKYREQQVLKNVWMEKKYQSEFNGTNLVKNILGEKKFDFPKSLYLMTDILKLTSKKNSVILDFFAGSGTTGHAVLEMNKEDGGNRRFILCTNNENNICKEVTYPRIKNVIKGYEYKGTEKKTLFEEKININLFENGEDFIEKIENIKSVYKERYDNFKTEFENKIFKLIGIKEIDKKTEGLDGNLRYFKTDFIDYNSYVTDSLKMKVTKNATELLCIKENAFEKIKDNKGFKIFKSNKHYVGIIFKDNCLHKFKEEIKKFDKQASIYVFSLFGEGAFEKQFNNFKNVKVIPVPEAILKVYMKIFFKNKRDIAYAA